MHGEPWDTWRFFAGTGPDGSNPFDGNVIDLECRDKWSTLPDTPSEFFYGIVWDSIPPHGVSASYLEIYRWRHCDQETARRWQETRERWESEHRAKQPPGSS